MAKIKICFEVGFNEVLISLMIFGDPQDPELAHKMGETYSAYYTRSKFPNDDPWKEAVKVYTNNSKIPVDELWCDIDAPYFLAQNPKYLLRIDTTVNRWYSDPDDLPLPYNLEVNQE